MYRYKIIAKDGKETKLNIPSNANEITFKQMAIFRSELKSSPDWYKKINSLSEIDEIQLSNYIYHSAKILSKTLSIDFLNSKITSNISQDTQSQLLTLFIRFRQIITEYKPKEIDQFKLNGVTYYLKKSVMDAFKNEVNPKLSLIELTLLMQTKNSHKNSVKPLNNLSIEEKTLLTQSEYLFNQCIENDLEFYQMVLIMIAILSKKDKEEIKPLDHNELEHYNKARVKELEELPLSVGLDFWFFFVNS